MPPGGANGVAVWMLEALKKQYHVSVLTFEPTDLKEINRFYGTSLKRSDLNLYHVNPLLRAIGGLDPDLHTIQPACYLMRVAKFYTHKYDIFISGDREMDFGRRGIQYVNYPYPTLKEDHWEAIQYLSKHGALRAILKGVYRPWMLLSGFSFERMKNNLTISNSQWGRGVTKHYYGIDTPVLYPPVIGEFRDVSWEQKENGFICVGRFDPAKKIEQMIETLAEVRKSHPDLHFHIVGTTAGTNPKVWSDYHKKILELAEANSSWVTVHHNLSRAELIELQATHRYGIHANEAEHFGMAIAEMVSAGCVTFVPNDGGQVEIVDDERLIYADKAQAIEKIKRVLANPTEQAELHTHMAQQKQKFSCEKFCHDFREIVRNF
ncbi:hypothetical protein IAD21_04605 [Abditibacteriota bacterium]|nr:hypothetical protein IAD21_04605 [Abditibacteriota bacterium]